MIKAAKEEDLIKIKEVAQTRLRPDKITGFFWLTLIFSGIMLGFTSLAIKESPVITNSIWPTIYKIEMVLFILNVVVALFFTPEKNAYRYQRLQAVLLSFFGFKLSIDFFPFYFLAAEDKMAPGYMSTIGLIILVGGLILTVYATLRAFKRVQQGEFRKDGNGLYNFKESKSQVSIPIIFGAVMIGGAIIQLASDAQTAVSSMIGVLFVLLLCTVLQYAIALVWPEFLILTISKFQFESFRVPLKKRKNLSQKVHTKGAKVKK
ncbi:hypothetical protein E1I69_11155 [Bacillus timonensis]|uniref:Uncharacterized protein n=1 Tax=Bacillus timonensis TaxID=1033734 RepID=A0A4S3PSW3_9BACI|nr:hypothetical protein [Bacillus timonensis]THE12415.1 hypothetical protein E1I69_11155 [Bacillus timonensis]